MKTIHHMTALFVCATALITSMITDRPFTPREQVESTQGPCTAKLVVSGLFCLTNDLTIGWVEIETNGVLCTNGYTLTITCDDGLRCDGTLNIDHGGAVILTGGGNCSVVGTVELEGTGLLFFDAHDYIVTGGAGKRSTIFGSDSDSSAIYIQSSKILMLDSNMTVSGRMKIQRDPSDTGVATLKNEGIVLADGAGILELADNLALEDASGGTRWKADGGSATLLFSRAHTTVCPSLQGDFLVTGDGTLNFDQSIYSLGNFLCAGTGTVAGTGELRYAYICDDDPPTYSVASSCP